MIDLPPGYSDPRLLGQGGFGAVYLAWSETFGRDVAVKLPFDEGDRNLGRELALELHAGASLRHPNIVQVLDAGTAPDGRPYLAMEYADAGSLADLTAEPEPWHRLLPLLAAVLDGLGHAHARGVIHRDIKAANILLARNDDGSIEPRIADFGLAKVLQEHGWYDSTRMGAGTMLYMPPEQFDRDLSAIHAGADLYSFGVLFYLLVCGRAPWEDRGVGPLLADKSRGRFEPVRPARSVGAPTGVAELIGALLSPRPAQRPDLAADVRRELLSLGEVRGTVRPSRGSASAVAAAGAPAVDDTWLVDYEDSAFRPSTADHPELPPLPPSSAPIPDWPATTGIAGVRVPRLVGRQGERLALWSFALSASKGPLGVVLEGQQGVGRSRLAGWLTCTLEEAGFARPLHLRAAQRDGLGDALVSAVRRVLGLGRMRGSPLRSRLEAWQEASGHEPAQDVAVLYGWLDPRSGGEGEDDDPVRRRARRLGVLERLLRTSAKRGLACVWLEDSGPGGPAAEVAATLLRLAQARPFPLLVLYEPSLRSPALDGFRSLSVGPLAEPDLRSLALDLLPEAAGADDVVATAGGNAAVAVQAARLLAAAAADAEPDRVSPPAAPLSISDVASARLDDFVRRSPEPAAARLVLGLLALLPRPASRVALRAAWIRVRGAGLSSDLFERFRLAGLVRLDRWGGVEFTDGAFAGAAERLVPPDPDGAALRLACAEALLELPSAPPISLAAGRLLLGAGQPRRALSLSSEAAAQLAGTDVEASRAAWSYAAAAVEALDLEVTDPHAVAVVLGRARAARNVGDLRETSELLAGLEGAELDPEAATEYLFLRCSIALSKGDLDGVLAASEAAVRPDLRVLRAEALRRGGRGEDAAVELAAGLSAATEAGDPRGALACRWRLARLRRRAGATEAARAGFEAALAEARQLADPADEAIVLRELGHLHLVEGRLAEAETALREGLDRADSAGLRVETAVTRLSLGELARKRGDLPTARHEYSAGLAVAHAYENTNLATVALLNLAITELAMDRIPHAVRRVAAMDRLVPPTAEHAYRPWIETVRAAVRAAEGRWAEAEEALAVVGGSEEQLRGQSDFGRLLAETGQRAADAGEVVVAAEAWRCALDLAELDEDDRARSDLRRRMAALALA